MKAKAKAKAWTIKAKAKAGTLKAKAKAKAWTFKAKDKDTNIFFDDDDPRHLGKRSPRYFWAALFFGGGHNAKLVSVVGLWHPGTVLCNLEG